MYNYVWSQRNHHITAAYHTLMHACMDAHIYEESVTSLSVIFTFLTSVIIVILLSHLWSQCKLNLMGIAGIYCKKKYCEPTILLSEEMFMIFEYCVHNRRYIEDVCIQKCVLALIFANAFNSIPAIQYKLLYSFSDYITLYVHNAKYSEWGIRHLVHLIQKHEFLVLQIRSDI